MNIGLLSGTFDPVHNGHIELAKCAQNQLKLDQVWLIPERIPRRKQPVASYEHRLTMLRILENNWLKVCSLEQQTHSFQIIEYLEKDFQNCRFTLLMGADVAAKLHTWDNYDKLKQKVEIATFSRNGSNNVEGSLPLKQRERSQDIRTNFERHRHFLSPKVRRYIEYHKLYKS